LKDEAKKENKKGDRRKKLKKSKTKIKEEIFFFFLVAMDYFTSLTVTQASNDIMTRELELCENK